MSSGASGVARQSRGGHGRCVRHATALFARRPHWSAEKTAMRPTGHHGAPVAPRDDQEAPGETSKSGSGGRRQVLRRASVSFAERVAAAPPGEKHRDHL
eukprot:scaffold1850_cov194-Pinguiococcus_pyrenoidosus.AAC.17